MKYETYICTHEWEIISENFEFEKFHNKQYDQEKKLGLTREAWDKDIPLYLHDIDTFSPDYIVGVSEGIVTTESIFSILGKDNLTFKEMLNEIWKRRKEIVKITAGDEEDNPYD
jgi:hypothetical protein